MPKKHNIHDYNTSSYSYEPSAMISLSIVYTPTYQVLTFFSVHTNQTANKSGNWQQKFQRGVNLLPCHLSEKKSMVT